jgi:hypothetical protein
LSKSETQEEAIKVPYKEANGSLLYLMQSTRPDITFAVNQISQFCESPKQQHWNTAKKILSYLQDKKHFGLRYGPSVATPIGYSDADFAGNFENRSSKSGFVFLLNG